MGLFPKVVAEWGDIQGDIANQTDLVNYIDANSGGDNAEIGYDIWLMAGQSNMAGRGTVIDSLQDINDPRVFQFGCASADARFQTIFQGNDPAHNEEGINTGKVSLIFPFARTLANLTSSKRRILLVPCPRGGTALIGSVWAAGNPGGSKYENAIVQANAAIIAAQAEFRNSVFKGIAWLQGESDGAAAQATYASNLDAVINGFRARITGAANVPFIVLQMVPDYVATTNGNVNRAHEDTPRRVQYTAFIYGPAGATYQNGDNLHYNAKGSRILGRNTALAIETALNNNATAALVPPAYAPTIYALGGTELTIEFVAPLCRFDSFKVEYRQVGNPTWLTASAPAFLGTRIRTITGLSGSTSYEVRVSTIAPDTSVSSPSPSATFTTNVVVAVPSQVLNLASGTISSSSVGLTWDLPTAGGVPTDYKIEYKENASPTWLTFSDGVSTNLFATVTGLNASTLYNFRVSGVNGAGDGLPSAVVNATTSAAAITPEAGATAHWVFGSDNPTYADLISSQTLTPNGSAPTLASGFMTINGQAAGLLSNIDETLDITVCCVATRENISAILGGTLTTSLGVGGISPFFQAGAIYINERGGAGNVAVDLTSDGLNQPIFIAFSFSSSNNRVLFVGKPTTSVVLTGNAPRSISSPVRKISVGDVHYNALAFTGSPKISEFIIFNSAKTDVEIAAIYGRSKTRMSARGINVY